jgi:hypothetical protein
MQIFLSWALGMLKFSSVWFFEDLLNLELDFRFSPGNLLNLELDHQFWFRMVQFWFRRGSCS